MRLDSRSGFRGILMNRDTGQRIRWVRWAEIPDDPEAPGEFEAFRSEPKAWLDQGFPLSEIIYRGRARLRFVPAAPKIPTKPTSPRDLLASLDDARRHLVNPKLLVMGEECEIRGCHRLASWRVSDEVEIMPERDTDGKEYERAVTVQTHDFCAAHLRLPTFTSLRGVQREVPIEKVSDL